MLRTNTKAAKQNLMNYIRSSAEEYISEQYELPTEGKQILASIAEIYRQEYRVPMTFDNFLSWAYGLPVGGLFDYVLCKGIETLGDILEETEEERSRYTESEAELMLTKLIYREVVRNS